MTAQPLPLPIGTLLAGKYRIGPVLGSGGMGTVFAAENVDLGRQVAIKVLHQDLAGDEDLARRLRQEARAAAMIGHPGIIDVLDLGTTDAGAPFIVMERLEGEALGARLVHRQRLPPPIAVGIVLKALEALVAAHDKGIIHRDLKPDNIFLVLHPAAGVKLVDFGISKQIANDVSVTTSGVVMGTPLYMSPEQARGARDVTPASDLYSMGAILYQTLAGVPPHVAHNYNEMISLILMAEPVPLATVVPELPRELTGLVDQLLRKDPAQRPTALEAANQLRVIARLLDSSNVAFSPTLQPDNVSDDELAMPAGHHQTLPGAAPPPPPLGLGETVASLPPGAAIAPTAAPTSPPIASPTSPPIALAPESSSPGRARLWIALLGVAALVAIVIAVLATRRAPTAIPPADALVAAPADSVLAPADASAPDTREPDAREPDARVPDAPPDAPVILRDAAARPDRASLVPDAAPRIPDAAAAGSGLDIDETDPLKKP